MIARALPVAWAILTAALAAGCDDPAGERPSVSSAAPTVARPSSSATTSASAPSANLTPVISASAAQPLDLRQLVLPLDEGKGARALADYRTALARQCAAGLPLEAPPGGSEPARAIVCLEPLKQGTALASGALRTPGADEVLLAVPSGLAAAEGEASLLLMRRLDGAYRMIGVLAVSGGFEVHARIASSPLDFVLVCASRGSMGEYVKQCGFVGHGSFAGPTVDPAEANALEVDLPTSLHCGPSRSARMGSPSLREGTLAVPISIDDVVREAGPDDSGELCSRARVVRSRRVDLTYELNGARPTRRRPARGELERALGPG